MAEAAIAALKALKPPPERRPMSWEVDPQTIVTKTRLSQLSTAANPSLVVRASETPAEQRVSERGTNVHDMARHAAEAARRAHEAAHDGQWGI